MNIETKVENGETVWVNLLDVCNLLITSSEAFVEQDMPTTLGKSDDWVAGFVAANAGTVQAFVEHGRFSLQMELTENVDDFIKFAEGADV
jgi:predicted nucleotidyltransferase